MGGTPYFYFVDETARPEFALAKLRQREFTAGRYRPGFQMRTGEDWYLFTFPPDEDWPSPGPAHASIEKALEASAEEGTCSILDIQKVSAEPEFMTANLVDAAQLEAAFGSARPSRQLLVDAFFGESEFTETADDFFAEVERGEARIIPFFGGETQTGWLFCGYSID